MIKLYGGGSSRVSIVQWYLEEIGVEYEYVMVDMAAGEHLQPPFLELNPMGKVPVIVDGDITLWESRAILLYLAEKYTQQVDTIEKRSITNQWILFANSTFAPGLFIEAIREKEKEILLPALDKIFATNSYVMGEEFTVADIGLGTMLFHTQNLLQIDISAYANLTAYLEKLMQREGFKQSIGKRDSLPSQRLPSLKVPKYYKYKKFLGNQSLNHRAEKE